MYQAAKVAVQKVVSGHATAQQARLDRAQSLQGAFETHAALARLLRRFCYAYEILPAVFWNAIA